VEEIRGWIKTMRGGVIELKQDYAAALDQVPPPPSLPSPPFRCFFIYVLNAILQVDTRRKKKTGQEIDASVQRTNGLASKIREELKLVSANLPQETSSAGLTLCFHHI